MAHSRCMAFLILMLAGVAPAFSQDAIDGKLMAEISRIRAIDNHTPRRSGGRCARARLESGEASRRAALPRCGAPEA